MVDAICPLCGSPSAHLSWQNRFGPKSGFGMFGSKAARVKGLSLAEAEWDTLAATCTVAFVHWEHGGDPWAVNNLRTLYLVCLANRKRSAEGREQKIRLHQLEALIACAEWDVEIGPALEHLYRAKGAGDGEKARTRQQRRATVAALIPRLLTSWSSARRR